MCLMRMCMIQHRTSIAKWLPHDNGTLILISVLYVQKCRTFTLCFPHCLHFSTAFTHMLTALGKVHVHLCLGFAHFRLLKLKFMVLFWHILPSLIWTALLLNTLTLKVVPWVSHAFVGTNCTCDALPVFRHLVRSSCTSLLLDRQLIFM
jgi:hypothetical protein